MQRHGLTVPRTRTVAIMCALSALILACGFAASSHASTRRSSAATAAASKKKLIVIDVPPLDNSFFAAEAHYATLEAHKLGYRTIVLDNNSDPNLQATQIQEAVSDHASAIILDNASSTASAAAIEKAKKAGVPTFLIDREINQKGVAIAQLVSNNYTGAQLGGEEFAKLMHDKGDYAELLGLATDTNAATRSEGFHSILNQIPGLHMVAQQAANWDQQMAFTVTETMLQAHPDIKGIISGNDTMALGAWAALKATHHTNVILVGMDGSPPNINLVKQGHEQGDVLQPLYVFATKAVEEANTYIKTGKKPAEAKQLLPCYLITAKNAKEVQDFKYTP